MDNDEAAYVFRFYGHLMTMTERFAYRHLVGTAKAMKGRTDLTAQTELRNTNKAAHLRKFLSDDPEVLRLTADGLGQFVVRTAERILMEHKSEIAFNRCPRCRGVARTPKARQCRFCGLDWHTTKP